MLDTPLAENLRPQTLSDYTGQEKAVGKNGIVTKLIKSSKDNLFFPSLIFWGPPGCGKTTLARIIAKELKKPFLEFSAVNTSVKDIKAQLEDKTKQKNLSLLDDIKDTGKIGTPVVFIDEIHRFNKAQQDALLPLVEQGKIIFIGATTENPSFEVIGPLLSRTRVIVLEQHSEEDLIEIINKAQKVTGVKLNKDALGFLVRTSNGDARVAINVFEIALHIKKSDVISVSDIEQSLQKEQLAFDLKGEEFYNTISAFHKSVRGSDPNAALYWLARMLEAGQDPLYIARRMIRMSSEDIGTADPTALNLAVSAFLSCEKVGMPECKVMLAETAIYLAKAPKSNKVYIAYSQAAEDVKHFGNLPVPMHIRNAPTKLMKDLGYGKNYNYYHDPKGEKLENEEYFPDKLKGKKYL